MLFLCLDPSFLRSPHIRLTVTTSVLHQVDQGKSVHRSAAIVETGCQKSYELIGAQIGCIFARHNKTHSLGVCYDWDFIIDTCDQNGDSGSAGL